MMVNWVSAPTKTSRGRWNTRRKSSSRSVMPMPNITTPSRIVTLDAAQWNVQGW